MSSIWGLVHLDSGSPYFNRETIESEFKYLVYSFFELSHSAEYESGSSPEPCLEAGMSISRSKTDFKLPESNKIKINLSEIVLSEQLNRDIFDKISGFESSFMEIISNLGDDPNSSLSGEIKSCFDKVPAEFKKDLNQLSIKDQFDCFSFWLEFLQEDLTNIVKKYSNPKDLTRGILDLKNLIEPEYSKFTFNESSKSKDYSIVVGDTKLSYLAMLSTNLCTAKSDNTVPVDLNVLDESIEVLDMGHFWFIDESANTDRIAFCGESEYFIVKISESQTVPIVGEINFTKKANKKLPNSESLVREYMRFVSQLVTLNEYSSLYLVLDPYICSNRPNIQKAIIDFAKGKKQIKTLKPLVVSNDPVYKTDTFVEVI